MYWEIQARSRSCCKCQREFLNGDRYRCVLTYPAEGRDEPFRRDFCDGCWGTNQSPHLLENEELISWWQSIVRILPPKPKEEAIKRSLAEQLLRKYLDFPERRYVNFCYILALMLERRRVLAQKHTINQDPSGKTLIVYEHNKTGETFIIQDPHLTLSQIGEVQAQVKEILDAEQKAQEDEARKESTEESEDRTLPEPSTGQSRPANDVSNVGKRGRLEKPDPTPQEEPKP